MPKFPEPLSAAELAADHPPDIATLAVGTSLWRVYFRGGPHPTTWGTFRHFGPTHNRFDHHEEPSSDQARGILYAAVEEYFPAFAEVFQETRTIDRDRNEPWLACFRLAEPLELLNLTGLWPTRVGASMAINTGQKGRARRWSRSIYEAYPDVRGIFYASSMFQNAPVVALYERAEDAFPDHPDFNRALADPTLFGPLSQVARHLRWRLT